MKIFLIGPGGVGKTTVGKLLADDLSYRFIDLDDEFCRKVGNISFYIKDEGYEQYCYQNSKLFYCLLNKLTGNVVISLSSGFLVHNELAKKHLESIQEGISVLLLPSKSLSKSIDIVVKRQIQRRFGLQENREREKIIERYPKYKVMGDIRIFSCERPDKIVKMIKTELNSFQKRF